MTILSTEEAKEWCENNFIPPETTLNLPERIWTEPDFLSSKAIEQRRVISAKHVADALVDYCKVSTDLYVIWERYGQSSDQGCEALSKVQKAWQNLAQATIGDALENFEAIKAKFYHLWVAAGLESERAV